MRTQCLVSMGKQILLVSLAVCLASCFVTGSSVAQPKSEEHPKEVSAPLDASKVATDSPKVEAKAAPVEVAKGSESESELNARKGRSEPPPDKKEAASTEKPASAADANNKDNKVNSDKSASSSSSSTSSKPSEKSPASKQATGSSSSTNNKQQLSGKSSTPIGPKNKLPANLGTVTSTGSGGAAHYMSKHDAYSAIAEKHGALAHDAMRKSDKRRIQTSFGGIQKASGIGDMLSPFKGVTDSGLARTLGASMRSIMKSKYSVPAYVASALLGAVALMAFYESPISPLPVPALPEPPVGRFPPELPSLPPGTQVPFRGSQQLQQQQQAQQYGQQYQRSFQAGQYNQPLQQQQPQQVLFPGQAQAAQQRQMNSAGPVQQLAANLLSSVGGKQQNAQRKSGVDYDLMSSSRSIFGGGSSASSAGNKLSSPANSQQQKQPSSFLSFFGLGGGAPGVGGEIQQASGLQQQISNSLSGMGPLAAAAMSAIEPKGQSANGLSNSHMVNKVKSYFSRSAAGGSSSPSSSSSSSSSGASSSSSNPYDQYQKMSFVQAFMKDTAFLPGFLSPNRKSSSSPQSFSSPSSSSSSSGSSASSSSSSGSGQPAAARMQTDNQPLLSHAQVASPIKRASNGFGLNRIAHALLDTFTAGIMQRSPTGGSQQLDRKSSVASAEQSPLLSATSLLTDIMSTYKSQVQQQPEHAQQSEAGKQQVQDDIAGGRAIDAPAVSAPSSAESASEQQNRQQQQQAAPSTTKSVQPQESSQQQQQPQQQQTAHVRKTRSIGFEYPVESNQALALRDNQPQPPSKAAQINNLVDLVSDSYSQNRLLFNFVMNQVGLSQAVPYVEQILGPTKGGQEQFQ